MTKTLTKEPMNKLIIGALKRILSLITFQSAKTSKHHSKQIKMNVYFEPQDLESTTFLKEQLMPLMENGLIEKIDLKLIPTGRATCDASHQEYE